ncbi:MAG: hypothetical protein JWL90_499 [Chthoniobacteraceae bacterium]|nr:hypothetical protein [Chthoniobacteraceae bacterium]
MKRLNCKGSTLVISIVVVAAMAAAAAIALNKTASLGTLTDRSRDYLEAQLVAEGAVEYGYGVWKKTIQNLDAPISTAKAAVAAPAFEGFDDQVSNGPLKIQATDEYGTPVASESSKPTPVFESLSDYPGWHGTAYNYVASARVGQTNARRRKVEAGVRRRFQYVQVPLFEAMFFYEHDLEMYKPASMIVSGLVHTNSDLYLSFGIDINGDQSPVTFEGNVSYAGKKFLGDGTPNNSGTNTAPPHADEWSEWTTGELMYKPLFPGGASAQVTHVERSEVLGRPAANAVDKANTNPNDDSFRELIEPPSKAVDPATGQVFQDPVPFVSRRLYNQAGIIITVDGSAVTVESQNGASLSAGDITKLTKAFTGKSTIYDRREDKSVEIANFDIGGLTPVLNSVSGFNGILYIHDVTAKSASNGKPKTIRLQNGGVLPDNGLTVVSQNPIYVEGDYNTGTTNNPLKVPSNKNGNPDGTDSPTVPGYTRKPAAVIGDAVMLLSNKWKDSKSSDEVNDRDASNTTYNMALLAGVMPSGYQPADGSPAYGYSGGANNYPRFLEDWRNKTCTYYGSMVELFQSSVFTGRWDTGAVYRPPTRCWNFDTNFIDNPPPGSLYTVAFGRGSWIKF